MHDACRVFVRSHESSRSYRSGRCVRLVRLVLAALVLCVLHSSIAQAQYFGRNKVQYRSFKFQVLKTEHFDIYYYPEEAEGAAIVGRMAERWRWRLTRFFSHDLRGRQA